MPAVSTSEPTPAGSSGDARPPAGGPRLIRLGSVLGVGIFVTPSWLLIVVFVTLTYADLLRQQIPGTSAASSYLLALLFAVALGGSVLLHEIGHTVVSRLLGLRVKRIVVFLLGGVSELDGEAGRPRDEFAIAVAGPLVSFVLAGLCWLVTLATPDDSAASVLLLLLAWSNLVIAVFNVLPGLPLDGGRLVQAVIWKLSRSRLTGVRIAAWSGRGVAVLVAVAVLLANAAVRGSGNQLSAISATVLGLAVAGFLWFGAGQTLRTAELAGRAARLELGRLIRPSVYLPAQTPVSEAVRQAVANGAGGIVVIDGDGRTRAIVREADVAGLELRRHPWTTLGEVATPLRTGLIIRDDLPGDALLAVVREHPGSEYLVIGADGVSRGVLATSDLARSLGLRYSGN
jgi:Zn-dependent protease